MIVKGKHTPAEEMNHNEQLPEEATEKRKTFIEWMNAHKTELLIIGVGIPTIITVTLGIQNKDAIKALWDNLKQRIEHSKMYSAKWFETAPNEILDSERERVRLARNSCNDDFSNYIRLDNLLNRFTKEQSRRSWAEKTPCGPSYHREHGNSLYKAD